MLGLGSLILILTFIMGLWNLNNNLHNYYINMQPDQHDV